MGSFKFKLLLILYFIVLLGLFLYSFTQIDLNLTLSRTSLLQLFQKKFMYIGYFKRPLSTLIYIILLGALFLLYGYTLFMAYRSKVNIRQLWILVGCTSVVLFLSYPAFSHDIFNYMFSAKTIVKYNQIPYKAKPMDFVGDPWLSFMRWIHRPGTYPPLWIVLTLPFYIFGFNFLIPIILNFKAIILLSYLGAVFLIGKIMEKINFRFKVASMVFFALNPLVIIESLVSAHNDLAMMFWALLAFYILYENKRVLSFFLFAISVGIKWVSVFLLPIIFIGPRRFFAVLFMIVGLLAVIAKVEILPWYLLWVLPFVAINVDRAWITIPSIGLSLGLLLRYSPFLYLGNWDPPVPIIKFWVTIAPLVVSVIIVIILACRKFLIRISASY